MALVDFRDPVACIPSLAIHLDREANDNRSVNAQEHLLPLHVCYGAAGSAAVRAFRLRVLGKQTSAFLW